MSQYSSALKFSFKEQLNNKFAFGLLIIFVPIWYWMLTAITPSTPVPFRLASTGTFFLANGRQQVLLSAGLNVLAMILGFMFFHSARHSLTFDRRLTRAGLSRLNFMLAKASTLFATTAVVALYTLLVLLFFWSSPEQLFEIWLAFWLTSLTYASIGLFLGMLLNSELAGFFIIIMLGQMDTFLQVPIDNPAANQSFLHFFPTYASMQLCISGGFTHLFPFDQVLLASAWFVLFFLCAFGIFTLRTQRKSSVTLTPAG